MTSPGNQTLPHYGAPFGAAITRFFRKYLDADGRASRSEFWWPQALLAGLLAVGYGLLWVAGSVDGAGFLAVPAVLVFVFVLVMSIGTIALSIRRLHDANLSGWWYLALFVGSVALNLLAPSVVSFVVGTVVSAIIGLLPTDPAGARFDEDVADGSASNGDELPRIGDVGENGR